MFKVLPIPRELAKEDTDSKVFLLNRMDRPYVLYIGVNSDGEYLVPDNRSGLLSTYFTDDKEDAIETANMIYGHLKKYTTISFMIV